MDIASIIALAVIAGLVFYIISIYNHLLRLEQNLVEYRRVVEAAAR